MTQEEIEQAGQLFSELVNNPETRLDALKLAKRARPHIPIPEVDARAQIEASVEERLKPLQEQHDKLQRQMMENDIRRELETSRAEIKRKYQLDDSQVKEIEQLMIDQKLPTHQSAAAVYLLERQPSTPRGLNRQEPVIRQGEDWRKELKNPKSRLFTDKKQFLNESFDQAWDDAFVKGL